MKKSAKSKPNDPANSRLDDLNQVIMDTVPVSVITIDKDGFITSANRYYKEFSRTGTYRNQNVFRNKFFKREGLSARYRKLLEDGTPFEKDNCYEKNLKGEDKYLKILAVPFRNEEGSVQGALSMAMDNTETVLTKDALRKANHELEERVKIRTRELDEANKKLRKTLKAKSTFMSDLSHELRTSLTIIQGNMEILDQNLFFTGEGKDAKDQIFQEIGRMSNMLSNLSVLVKSDYVLDKLDLEAVNIGSLIFDVVKSLEAVAFRKKVNITPKDENLEKITLKADREKLEKMLMNLISNAIKYSRRKGEVEVWAEDSENEIKICVKDSGIGIAKEHVPLIFRRFYRVDYSRSRKKGGSGLGLAICKWVAGLHGGKISVLSELNKGSLFTVQLPKR